MRQLAAANEIREIAEPGATALLLQHGIPVNPENPDSV